MARPPESVRKEGTRSEAEGRMLDGVRITHMGYKKVHSHR